MKKITSMEICREVFKDAKNHNGPASVSVFLSHWVPWMFRKINNQQKEILCLRRMIDERGNP